ncbi:MAG: altronate dehydratase, partial [Bacillota bacterium]
KGGSSPVRGVNGYGEQIDDNGLQLLEGPGNDLVSTTNLTATGAQIILFTTGRGTPFGGPVPTMKIATNNQLYHKKSNWMDFNAGKLLESNNLNELAEDLYKMVIKIASGQKRTKNEINDFKEMTIFKKGVTL